MYKGFWFFFLSLYLLCDLTSSQNSQTSYQPLVEEVFYEVVKMKSAAEADFFYRFYQPCTSSAEAGSMFKINPPFVTFIDFNAAIFFSVRKLFSSLDRYKNCFTKWETVSMITWYTPVNILYHLNLFLKIQMRQHTTWLLNFQDIYRKTSGCPIQKHSSHRALPIT